MGAEAGVDALLLLGGCHVLLPAKLGWGLLQPRAGGEGGMLEGQVRGL